jgi:hypothetical protein
VNLGDKQSPLSLVAFALRVLTRVCCLCAVCSARQMASIGTIVYGRHVSNATGERCRFCLEKPDLEREQPFGDKECKSNVISASTSGTLHSHAPSCRRFQRSYARFLTDHALLVLVG